MARRSVQQKLLDIVVAGHDRNAYAAKHRDMLDACSSRSDSHKRDLHSMPDIDVCKPFVSSSGAFGSTQNCGLDKGSDS